MGRGQNGSANLSTSAGKGATIGVGETIEGVRLVEIEKTWIVVEFGAERRTLRVGEKAQ